MDKDKKLKDPIYGYISIPVEIMKDVVDTAVFQRLRRIVQTSYAPLYSSAVHNRFVHSIGVFHLGRIASGRLQQEILDKGYCEKNALDNYVRIYQYACLLHDVGHAPFSHTGEGFYKTEDYSSRELHKMLLKVVGNDEFLKDIPKEESRAAAAHEIMSCIVGIQEFGGDLFKDSQSKEFFARCITGYQYSTGSDNGDIKNCFISMLNSKVIDVDRLDYLIRDAYFTGFETVNIDYLRLLNALTVVGEKGKYQIAYHKDALSIIENAVYAHDAEKKWIQNHPTAIYEGYLIKHIITCLNETLNKKGNKLFSVEALSRAGVQLKDKIHVSLLCDDDIIYLSKNLYSDEISREFFERKSRRRPVWKSEAEYKAYIAELSSEGQLKDEFLDCLKSFVGGNQKDMQEPIAITQALEEKIESEMRESEELLKDITDETERASYKQQQKGAKNRLNFCRFLNKYAREHDLDGDFIVIRTDMFNSAFSKDEITNLLIVFKKDGEEKIKRLFEVCPTLKAEKIQEEFYYLFYRSGSKGKIHSKTDFCREMYLAAHSLKVME